MEYSKINFSFKKKQDKQEKIYKYECYEECSFNLLVKKRFDGTYSKSTKTISRNCT
jgi:hypothetical protein